ncbi:hypothetical protein FH972_024202 [Carpinus fangiana]|uniref:Uncharacterized protein n=1 Tax=Carpinus fangiana TaxID=176857 RepID=A0A5N6KXQ6_9ROSI|nr:hypothetical protein FH972_024202 [Carpinus fangiana]
MLTYSDEGCDHGQKHLKTVRVLSLQQVRAKSHLVFIIVSKHSSRDSEATSERPRTSHWHAKKESNLPHLQSKTGTMSDNLDPSGPSQPSLNQAYTTPGNPATHSSSEQDQRDSQSQSSHVPTDKRNAQSQSCSTSDATPSSLGYGIHGAPAGEERKGRTEKKVGRHNEKDGEQMRAPGEGETADAVENKPGAGGSQPSLTSDLDRKKAEQAPLRDAVDAEKRKDVDVGGVLGQRGGPASSVD